MLFHSASCSDVQSARDGNSPAVIIIIMYVCSVKSSISVDVCGTQNHGRFCIIIHAYSWIAKRIVTYIREKVNGKFVRPGVGNKWLDHHSKVVIILLDIVSSNLNGEY